MNDYLGFERSVFTENGFGDWSTPYVAMWHSDQQLADYLLADLDAADGSPLFSFAVSYQNHGPYAETESTVPHMFRPKQAAGRRRAVIFSTTTSSA